MDETPLIGRAVVTDWSTDFDHTTSAYAAAAPEIWEELRTACPVAHTDRFGGAWLPTRHADVSRIAKDTEHFTSRSVVVSDWRTDAPKGIGFAPPITSDPPFHTIARSFLLPAFSPAAVQELRGDTERICDELIDQLLSTGESLIDGASGYAQHIPVRVIAQMLGVPESDGEIFRGFIHRVMEEPGQHEVAPEETMWSYLRHVVADHREHPRQDLIGYLMGCEINGRPLIDDHVIGTVALLLIAGIDTTWSAIGASIWHLATHPDHQQALRDGTADLATAVEELLRFYAPVTMARLVSKPVTVGDAQLEPEDWVLLSFPAANRDPEAFDRADEVVLDRASNRHLAFGLGIHRCIGSNLARMELTVALERWLDRMPPFRVADPDGVRWSTGQVRGPRELPLRLEAR